jgi:hypothetical protein
MLSFLPTAHTSDRSALCIADFCGFSILVGLLLLFAPAELSAAPEKTSSAESARIEFNRDIRPILSDACFACHGPDKHSRQADLRLDDRDSAMAAGAITPNSPDSSSILERIDSHDPDLLMPPAKTGKSITPEQRKMLESWIQQGAFYQPHWAFVPIPKQLTPPPVSPPETPTGDTQTPDMHTAEIEVWNRSPIDRWVLKKLLEQQLLPAKQTDPLTWLRRVSFDLTGLPPSPEWIESLSKDSSPENKARLVDQLLQSEAYAERMANMWLDVARYADTFGYQADVNMDVWPWRDWVIRAFRDNLPYDQFLTWQLAGDLLPNASIDQRLATTFNRLHRQTNEGGSIEEEFRQVYVADRTVTAGTAFLGLTFECSRCHDHKYDPISQKDFYSFAAYFADIDEHGLYSHFTRATPTPALALTTAEQEERITELQNAVADSYCSLQKWIAEQSSPSVTSLLEQVPLRPTWEFPLEGLEDAPVGKGARFNGDDAQSFALNTPHPTEEGKSIQHQLGLDTPFSFSLWLKPDQHASRVVIAHQSVAAEDAAFRGMQLVLEQGRPQFSLIHFWPGDAIRVESLEAIAVQKWTHVAVTYDGSSQASGLRIFVNGTPSRTRTIRDQLRRDFRYRGEWGDSNSGSVQFSLGARFRDVGFRDGSMDDLKIYTSELSNWDIAQIYLQATSNPAQSEQILLAEQAIADRHPTLFYNLPQATALLSDLESKRKAANDYDASLRYIMTMSNAIVARPMHILERGAYDSPRDQVSASPPSNVGAASPPSSNNVSNRLDLARWMLDDSNPLTARVAVNRWWAIFFGRGIVASLEDFGSQGAVPSHPELLDWLARDFISNGWDLKHLCKSIVLSETYQQSSVPRKSQWEGLDPENKLLFHGPRHRLSAEQVRDAALAASELLARKVGGPSVMPYQPSGVWEEAGTGKSYSQAKGEGLYRRSMYTFWRRTAPPPSMLAFDATSRETCTARRETTTTPLQALVLLNDPQYIEAGRQIAQASLLANRTQTSEANDARIQAIALRIVNRPLTLEELAIARECLDEQRDYFSSNPQAASEYLSVGDLPPTAELVQDEASRRDLAAMSVVAGMLMCFDDFVMKR